MTNELEKKQKEAKRVLMKVIMDFAIQFQRACRYRHFEDYTRAELQDWISEFIDYRWIGKQEEIDEKSESE